MTDKRKEMEELKKLEFKLKTDVDADFFLDPHQFRTLPRVIDILGAQLLESESSSAFGAAIPTPNLSQVDHKAYFDNLHKNNPAYSSLRKQQNAIEEAIEHLSLVHYKDLNASVVAVGQVSKRFGEAVGQVKGLRTQVMEIREHLANASDGGADHGIEKDGHADNDTGRASSHGIGGKSLRELWLKKLESEAVLSLLQKLDVVRRTPGAFDVLVHSQPCRIGAAVVILSDAIDTMFNGDVSQIQALNTITEQLMGRKQKAEEVVWETLQDILYLRTGNPVEDAQGPAIENGNGFKPTSISVELDKGLSGSSAKQSAAGDGAASKRRAARFNGVRNKHSFVSTYNQRHVDASDNDSDDDSLTDDFSSKSGQNSNDKRAANQRLAKPSLRKNATTGSYFPSGDDPLSNTFANFHDHQGHLLPKAMIDSELDLEADELRCLETFGITAYSSYSSDGILVLPRYNDFILGLRILVEALAKLKRLDDVERCISENIDRELRKIAEMEQAKTLAKLEKRRNKGGNTGHRRNSSVMGIDGAEEKLKDFRMHMKSLLTSFGSVMLRLSHLAQILRHRIVSIISLVCPLLFWFIMIRSGLTSCFRTNTDIRPKY